MYITIYIYMKVHVHVAVFMISSYGAPLISPKSFLFGTAQFSLWA